MLIKNTKLSRLLRAFFVFYGIFYGEVFFTRALNGYRARICPSPVTHFWRCFIKTLLAPQKTICTEIGTYFSFISSIRNFSVFSIHSSIPTCSTPSARRTSTSVKIFSSPRSWQISQHHMWRYPPPFRYSTARYLRVISARFPHETPPARFDKLIHTQGMTDYSVTDYGRERTRGSHMLGKLSLESSQDLHHTQTNCSLMTLFP